MQSLYIITHTIYKAYIHTHSELKKMKMLEEFFSSTVWKRNNTKKCMCFVSVVKVQQTEQKNLFDKEEKNVNVFTR